MIALLINYILITSFSALLITAAIIDMRQFIIPNYIPLSLFILFLLSVFSGWVLNAPLFPTSPWFNLLTSVGVLFFFVILFATGQMGGGDVKLITAVSLWAGPHLVLDFLLITALVGGIIAAVQLVRNGTAKKSFAEQTSPDAGQEIFIPQKAVPYGLAIGFGGLYCAQQLLNQLN